MKFIPFDKLQLEHNSRIAALQALKLTLGEFSRAAGAMVYGLGVFKQIFDVYHELDNSSQELLGDTGDNLNSMLATAVNMYNNFVVNEKMPKRNLSYLHEEMTGTPLLAGEMTSFENTLQAVSVNRKAVEAELWIKQCKNWPEAVRLTIYDVLKAPGNYQASAALAMQYEVVVFYRLTDSVGTTYGYRFGLEDGDYVSLFPANGNVSSVVTVHAEPGANVSAIKIVRGASGEMG